MIGICVIKRVKRLTYYCLQLANINDYGVYPEALVLSYVKKISINTTFHQYLKSALSLTVCLGISMGLFEAIESKELIF